MFLAVDMIWSATRGGQILQQLTSTGFFVPSVLWGGAGTPAVSGPITILGHPEIITAN